MKWLYSALFVLCCSPVFGAKGLESQDHLKILAQTQEPNPQELAFDAVYKLNQDKSEIYSKNLGLFQKNLLDNNPVILALFSSKGGKFILYRPHQQPLYAPDVPKEYEIVKAVGHGTLALYSFVVPYLSQPKNTLWKASLANYLQDNKKALESLDALNLGEEIKGDMKKVLQDNIDFMSDSMKKKTLNLDDLKTYTAKQGPSLQKLLRRATNLQVGHWVDILSNWKTLLGEDFKKTYAVANAVYVTRVRNVLFTVLAQFFREEAFNDRLFLFETTDFDMSPEALLAELTRVVSDRAIGEIFFGGKYEMDVELLGSAARLALKEHEAKLPGPLLLAPLRPAGDIHRWPW